MALEDIIQGAVETSAKGDDGDAGGAVEEQVVEGAGGLPEGSTGLPDDTGETQVNDAAEVARKAAEEAEQAFAKEHELLDKTGKRENRIPYNRVKKIVEAAQIKLAKQVLGDNWKDLGQGQKLDDVVKGHLDGLSKKLGNLDTYERELKAVDAVGEMMRGNPEKFLELLPQVNPRYAELLRKEAEKQVEQQTQGNDPKPEPDQDFGNGMKTYSTKGLQDLLDWQARQVEQRISGRIDKDMKPIRDREQAQEAMQASLERVRAKLDNARQTWSGFTQNEDAIRKHVEQGMDLHLAYVKVMDEVREKTLAESKVDREKMRAELIEELKNAPKSTSTATASRNPKADAGGEAQSMEDIIRNAMKVK